MAKGIESITVEISGNTAPLAKTLKSVNSTVKHNEGAKKQELGEMVLQSVEGTQNAPLDEEADRLTNAIRYERKDEKLDTRAGRYKRKFLTKAGEVKLKVTVLLTYPIISEGAV